MARSQSLGRLSAHDGKWHGRQIDDTPSVDPYGPDSDDYASRHRQAVMELPGGLLRIDIGAPAAP